MAALVIIIFLLLLLVILALAGCLGICSLILLALERHLGEMDNTISPLPPEGRSQRW